MNIKGNFLIVPSSLSLLMFNTIIKEKPLSKTRQIPAFFYGQIDLGGLSKQSIEEENTLPFV